MIQLFSANGQLGRSYYPAWWNALAKLDDEFRMSGDGSVWDQLKQMFGFLPTHQRKLGHLKHRVLGVKVPYNVDWTTRRGMDWFVNSVIRETIKFTTPILVNSEEPLDFVKDCMAIFFLTQLDDLTEDFSLSILELRALVKYSIVHRNKCRDLYGWVLQNVTGSDVVEVDLTESFIQQVQLTDDEQKAVEDGLGKNKKTAWRRVRKDEFHKELFYKLLDEEVVGRLPKKKPDTVREE
uniref:Uncharacterized protein n=1 Tax=Noctiluca scintillans TaxID=2966 RepID=A0A7S1EXT2_NOCSC